MRKWQRLALFCAFFFFLILASQTFSDNLSQFTPATFSIVALDPENGDLGVAVASKFFGVGTVVPWAKAEVGAIATQAFANTTFGPEGLTLMGKGHTADKVLQKLISGDIKRDERQVGIVDFKGTTATYTGSKCNKWAGDLQGKNYTVQGNILTGEKVVMAMGKAFENSKGELAERLMESLEAGESAGGDSRGKQSAALLVVRNGGGYGGFNDRYIDLRVDDHLNPLEELKRLLDIKLTMNHMFKAYALYEEKKIEDAIKEMGKAVEKDPENSMYQYNLACFYSLAGKKSKAMTLLEKAFALDPQLRSHAETDSDLDGLRGESTFKKLMEERK
jgi:uncharacterized Ntn-hydrolase superfamily protein